MSNLRSHLASVPSDLTKALDQSYSATIDHYVKEEWDDAQVDAGRLCEAVLRYLEWKMEGSYTAIDGKKKPNRKTVVSAALNDTALPATLRAQVPQGVELVTDFRNNRNSAHLGDIDANKMDCACVVQVTTWIVGEIVRLETNKPVAELQAVLDQLAERHVPLVQKVGDQPVVLAPDMGAADRAIVLLYQHGTAVPIQRLRDWAEYGNSTRWRDRVIKGLQRKKFVHVSKGGEVSLLHPGEQEAQKLLLAA